jgi:fatty acid desaturase
VATGKTVAKGCGISLAVLALIVGSWFAGGALLMLLVGALYGSFGWLAPIGILPATGIYVAGSILAGLLRRGKRA